MSETPARGNSRFSLPVIVAAIVILCSASFLLGERVRTPPQPNPPGALPASLSVDCRDKEYRVSTGNDSGTCKTLKNESGDVMGAVCTDNKGNSSDMTCKNGKGRCDETKGSGSCDIEQK